MSGSTTNLDLISASQASKEVTANDLFDAGSPATLYGRRATTTAALTWGYYGGTRVINGVATNIANGTVALTANLTNYVEANRATGAVTANTTGFTAGADPLYTIVAGASTITSYTDNRTMLVPVGLLSKSVAAGGTITLSNAESNNHLFEFTGILPNNTTVIFPATPARLQCENLTTGAFSLTIKTAAGVGVVIPQSSTLNLYCNGVNIEDSNSAKEDDINRDASGGYVGKTLEKINFWNAARTFMSFLTNAATAVRTYTFPDRDGTVALKDDAGIWSGTTGGSTTAYTLTPTPAIAAYADGQRFLFIVHATNTSAGATFAVSGLPALPSTMGGVAMPIGGLLINNKYWGLIESGGTAIRIAPYDAMSVMGDTAYGTYTYVGTSATDAPTLGAEFLTGTGWTSTNWTGSWAAGWTHTAGNTSPLSYPTAAVISTRYLISYVVTGRTAGSFTIDFGGQSVASLTATGLFGPTTISTANLVITPTSTFDGTIVLSIKQITAVASALAIYQDSSGTERMAICVSNVLSNTNIGTGAGSYSYGQYMSNFGYGAGFNNTTGVNNTNTGASSGYFNTTGYNNTNSGYIAGRNNTTGNSNANYGVVSGFSGISGSNGASFGYAAGYSNVTGSNIVSIGASSNYELGGIQTAGAFTVGISYTIRTIGTTDFTLIGAASNTIGLVFTTTGVGTGTGTASANVSGNTSVGYNTGRGVVVGSNNTIIGANVTGLAATLANNIILATGQGTIRSQFNGTDWNFQGSVGIGVASPTAYIHTKAGVAAAGGAPIKLTSGVDLTTPEAGAIEYDGTNLHFSPSTVRKTVMLGASAALGTAPTIASGFGTTPTIPFSNGAISFEVNVGTGGIATSGVITMPAAANGWTCKCMNETSAATTYPDVTAMTTTSITITNFSRTTGLATAWAASEIFTCMCIPY